MPDSISVLSLWTSGPEFLLLDQNQWLSLPSDLVLSSIGTELKKIMMP